MKEKEELQTEEIKKEMEHEKQENYMSLGMLYSAALGSCGMVMLSAFGQIAYGGFCIAIGVSLGMLIGMSIPNKK